MKNLIKIFNENVWQYITELGQEAVGLWSGILGVILTFLSFFPVFYSLNLTLIGFLFIGLGLFIAGQRLWKKKQRELIRLKNKINTDFPGLKFSMNGCYFDGRYSNRNDTNFGHIQVGGKLGSPLDFYILDSNYKKLGKASRFSVVNTDPNQGFAATYQMDVAEIEKLLKILYENGNDDKTFFECYVKFPNETSFICKIASNNSLGWKNTVEKVMPNLTDEFILDSFKLEKRDV